MARLTLESLGECGAGVSLFFFVAFFFDADPLVTPRSFFTPATPPPRFSPPLSPPTMSSALRATPARVAGTNKVGGEAGVWSRRGSARFCPLLLLAVARGGHRAASHARHLVNLAMFLQKGAPSRGGVGGGAEWRRALNWQTPSSPGAGGWRAPAKPFEPAPSSLTLHAPWTRAGGWRGGGGGGLLANFLAARGGPSVSGRSTRVFFFLPSSPAPPPLPPRSAPCAPPPPPIVPCGSLVRQRERERKKEGEKEREREVERRLA